jgi:hypothetical protein
LTVLVASILITYAAQRNLSTHLSKNQ